MPQAAVDPARLEGERLRQWYLRTPAEVEAERRAAGQRRHAVFFGTPSAQTRSNPAQVTSRSTQYGALQAPPSGDMDDLRRQQVEFRNARDAASRQNRWMAAPALAPVALATGLALGAGLSARYASRVIPTRPQPPPALRPTRGGDSEAARLGRQIHRAMEARVNSKPGWQAEKLIDIKGVRIRPDIQAPPRATSKTDGGYIMELKPNTPSGRRAAQGSVERYQRLTQRKTRAIFYGPKSKR
jgi:hypothetical protein